MGKMKQNKCYTIACLNTLLYWFTCKSVGETLVVFSLVLVIPPTRMRVSCISTVILWKVAFFSTVDSQVPVKKGQKQSILTIQL